MNKLFIFLILLCSVAFGQQTITCTVASTPTFTAGTLTFPLTVTCPASTGLPPGIGWDGSTFTVPNLSAQKLILTGGTAYPDGLYLNNFKSGVLTYTPYVPPSSGGSGPISCTVQMPSTKVSGLQAAEVTVACPGISHTAMVPSEPQPLTVPPLVNGQRVWRFDAWIPADGQITVLAWLMYLNPPQTFPATTFVVKVQ